VRTSDYNFLSTVWRSGALEGITPEAAFFDIWDRTTMIQDNIDNGWVICFTGIAPVKPAKFVIFRSQQKTRKAQPYPTRTGRIDRLRKAAYHSQPTPSLSRSRS
jgi:hypothetical protein